MATTAAQLDLNQLLMFVVTGLVAFVWRSVEGRFKALDTELSTRLLALENSMKERLLNTKEDFDNRTRDRAHIHDSRFSTMETTLSRLSNQISKIDDDFKELRVSLASKYMTREEMRDRRDHYRPYGDRKRRSEEADT